MPSDKTQSKTRHLQAGRQVLRRRRRMPRSKKQSKRRMLRELPFLPIQLMMAIGGSPGASLKSSLTIRSKQNAQAAKHEAQARKNAVKQEKKATTHLQLAEKHQKKAEKHQWLAGEIANAQQEATTMDSYHRLSTYAPPPGPPSASDDPPRTI